MSLKMSEQKKSRGKFPRHRWNTINPVTHKDSLDMEVDMEVDMDIDTEVMDMEGRVGLGVMNTEVMV